MLTTHERLFLDDGESLQALRWWVEKTRPALIVIDPLFAATISASISSSGSAREVLANLKAICVEFGCAGLVLHHLNKGRSAAALVRIAASGQIAATASMCIVMDMVEREGARYITLECHGRGAFANRSLVVRSEGPAHYELSSFGELAQPEPAMEERVLAALREGGPQTAVQVARRVGIRLHSARPILNRLMARGAASSARGARNTLVWRAHDPPPRCDA